MHLQSLSLLNYKSFEQLNLRFETKINCFVGNNGVGKTNILDAIYHLAYGKGYFNTVATQNIYHGQDFYMIDGHFIIANNQERVMCSYKKGWKKTLKRNDKNYEKLSDHLGLIPLVIISPADQDLISAGSDSRRKFIDGIIGQFDKNYLSQLIAYQRVIEQRNALLKYFALNQTFDHDTLLVYDTQLIQYGLPLHNTRIKFIEEFVPVFQKQYERIAQQNEEILITYQSQLNEGDFKELLDQNLKKDRALQYSTIGIHKDDYLFSLSNFPIKKFGSQGQQKSFLIALRLSQFLTMKKHMNTTPILLLDDIFDKLDENRVSNLIALVNEEGFGQIFITDTHTDRTENLVKQLQMPYQFYDLNALKS